ncbi:MAG: radical SAM protein [Deltaproteobacteria bacterium]|nr:radical SAM protein [Deltaproteobacteria bacterium]
MTSLNTTEPSPFPAAALTDSFRPSLVSWNLTKRCNLRCPHCYLSAGKKAEEELTTEECFALIDEMKELGTEMVILTGGEPLLRKDIFDLAQRCAEKGLWVVMGTNGVLINDRVAAKMVECGIKGVGISIDSIHPEKHNSFRGGPNSWEHSVRALEICRSHGLEVLVQSTVMADNFEEVPQLIEFARDKGAWSFNLYFLVQTGRGQLMNDLSAPQTEAILGQLVESQEAYRPMLVRSKCAPHFKRLAYEQGLGGLESGGCMAGTQYCRITPEGEVTPCPYMDLSAGNVRDSSFTEIWQGSTLLQELRDVAKLGGRCGDCEFNELCGGCRCRAYAAYEDPLAEDPACTYQPTGKPLDNQEVLWDSEARARLDRIPIAFIRNKVRSGLESFARRKSLTLITAEVMKQGLQGGARPRAFPGMPPFGPPK